MRLIRQRKSFVCFGEVRLGMDATGARHVYGLRCSARSGTTRVLDGA
jgi:hypothetical protein